MQIDTETLGGAAIWLVMMLLLFAFYRAKTRRNTSASYAGAVYGMMNDEKRKAIEVVVSDKAAAHDFEHADDDKVISPKRPRPLNLARSGS
jgi:hypothetical protein